MYVFQELRKLEKCVTFPVFDDFLDYLKEVFVAEDIINMVSLFGLNQKNNFFKGEKKLFPFK